MLLSATSGIRGKVIDLDTGLWVRKVIDLDTDAGYIRAYSVTLGCAKYMPTQWACKPDCTDLTHGAESGEKYEATGRFKFVHTGRKVVRQITMGAAKCAKCPSTMTLPGDDLCPRCRALQSGQKVERLEDFSVGHKCNNCSRDAVWSVSDETEVTPQTSGVKIETRHGRRFVVPVGQGSQQWCRAMMVKRRWYCSRCFQPPQLVDARGEVVRQLEVGNRPD